MIKAPENISVDAGNDAKFSCVMGGDPSPQIKWIREGGKVSYVSSAEEDAAVLRIKNVTNTQAGKYVCQAENIAGDASMAAFLSIQGILLLLPSSYYCKKVFGIQFNFHLTLNSFVMISQSLLDTLSSKVESWSFHACDWSIITFIAF